MNYIKVAHILHSVGGVDVSLRLILKNIDSSKFESIVIKGVKDTKDSFFDKENKKILQHNTSIYRDINLFSDLKSIFQAYKILKKEKPNIIHAHSSKGGLVGRIAGFLLSIPVFYTPQAFSFLSTSNPIKKRIFILIERILILKGNYIIASSESEMNRAISEVKYPKERVLLFKNCINEINNIKPLSIQKNWPDEYICTVGRPSFQKNIERMILIFNEVLKMKSTHLVIMGVGHHVGQLESVKNLIQKLQLTSKVTLLDWTSQSDVHNIIKNSSLYISTARYEGLPYSIIESLALGVPCVVSNCDGNRDIIINGYNGYIIDDNDDFGFKEKIISILDDKEIFKKLSQNSLDTFKNKFEITKNIKNLEELYRIYSKKND